MNIFRVVAGIASLLGVYRYIPFFFGTVSISFLSSQLITANVWLTTLYVWSLIATCRAAIYG